MTPQPSDSRPAQESPLLGPDGGFARAWLTDKRMAPVPAGTHLDAAVMHRVEAGCRAVGARHLLDASTAAVAHRIPASAAPRRPTETGLVAPAAPPLLLHTPDLRGAVLFPEAGYTLIAGTEAFMSAAVPEGIDAARARFGRYARALKERWPHLQGMAAAYPPVHEAWSHPADVTRGTATARLMTLLDDFAQGTATAAEFADGWRETRRAAQSHGERASGALAELLDRVFMVLEDYTPDPELRDPGDLTDGELRRRIGSLVQNTQGKAEQE